MQINIKRDKSFADDLIKGRGIVSGRVALLLRSAEIKPLFYRFVPNGTTLPMRYVVVAEKTCNFYRFYSCDTSYVFYLYFFQQYVN